MRDKCPYLASAREKDRPIMTGVEQMFAANQTVHHNTLHRNVYGPVAHNGKAYQPGSSIESSHSIQISTMDDMQHPSGTPLTSIP
jgi:hypothetical protein